METSRKMQDDNTVHKIARLLYGLMTPILRPILALWRFIIWRIRYVYLGDKLPGPKCWPLIGGILNFRSFTSKGITDFFLELPQIYGYEFSPAKMYLGPFLFVYTNSLKDHEMLLSGYQYMEKGFIYKFLQPWLATGLLTSTGDKWRSRRKMLTPAFHFKIIDQFVPVFNSCSDVFVQQLRARVGPKGFDVWKDVKLLTLDVICETAMGYKINAQIDSTSEYVTALNELLRLTVARGMKPWLYSDFIYWLTPSGRKYKKCLTVLHGTTDRMIRERRKDLLMLEEESGTLDVDELGRRRRVVFLDLLLLMARDGSLSDMDIREEVDTFLFEVCEAHFHPDDILRVVECYDENGKRLQTSLGRIKLKDGAIPSILPNCPKYLSSYSTARESGEEKRERIENRDLQLAIDETLTSVSEFQKKFCFDNFSEFLNCVKNVNIPAKWNLITNEDCASFIVLDESLTPSILLSAKMQRDLQFSVFVKNVEVKNVENFSFPLKLKNINTVIDILNMLREKYPSGQTTSDDLLNTICDLCNQLLLVIGEDFQEKVKFLGEQLKLLVSSKYRNRYSPEFSVFCSILYTISPHAYKFLRSAGYFTVPHPQTINNICMAYSTNPLMEQNKLNFLIHIKQKFKLLEKDDLIVSLMVDEIHIKPYLDYSGGSMVGVGSNSEKIATSAHVFMIQSLKSPFKEVVHILPVHKMNAEKLFKFIKEIVVGLHEIGFTVVCVVSDNNPINRKAITYFSSPPKLSIVYPHPCDNSCPLFFAFDSVHIIKCIRNNWINQIDQNQSLIYPPFGLENNRPVVLSTAAFSCIKRVYELESQGMNLIKYAHKLNLKSLSPSSFERQNVRYVLNVFNDHVVQGLLAIGIKHELENFEGTAEFLKLVLNWWNIVNVKSPFLDERFRNSLQKPLALNQENIQYLEKFLVWLDNWDELCMESQKLTKETHLALSHTTHALMELTKYCVSELNFQYILPGKIQTDSLEARFGKYRTMAGSQYLVSIRQIFEVESKIRIQNLLPLTLKSHTYGEVVIPLSPETENNATEVMVESCSLNLNLQYTEEDFEKTSNYLPVITYLGGYCARSVMKKIKCGVCRSHLLLDKLFEVESNLKFDLIKNIDRGGLLYPQPDVVNVIILNYITVQKLVSAENEMAFLQTQHQRNVVIHFTEKAVRQHNFFLVELSCNIHSVNDILRHIVKVSTNLLLNNYIKIKNDNLIKYGKRRKLSTVKK